MKTHKNWIAKIISLLVVASFFLLLNYVITNLIGDSLSKNILKDEKIRDIVELIKESNTNYNKISIVMRNETSHSLFSFFIFAFLLSTFVVFVYSHVLAIARKILRLK